MQAGFDLGDIVQKLCLDLISAPPHHLRLNVPRVGHDQFLFGCDKHPPFRTLWSAIFSVDLRGCRHWLRANVESRGFPRQVPRLMALPRQRPPLGQRYVPRSCP